MNSSGDRPGTSSHAGSQPASGAVRVGGEAVAGGSTVEDNAVTERRGEEGEGANAAAPAASAARREAVTEAILLRVR